MIRPFEPTDMNPLVHFIMEQSREIGGNGYADANQQNIIEFVKDWNITPDSKFFIAEQNLKIQGYACVQIVFIPWNGTKVCNIDIFYVAPQHRNGYIANNLYDSIEDYAKQNNCKALINAVLMYDENYQPQQDFIDNAHAYFGKKMVECGKSYVKEIV